MGGDAADAADVIGAEAYATGNSVAFATPPSLFVAAHEAAHVVQQRAGVSLLGGVGQAGDAYEQQADAVAERVVRGESAEALLGEAAPGAATGSAVQRMPFGDVGDAVDDAATRGAASATISPSPDHRSVRVGETFKQAFQVNGAGKRAGRWQVTPSSTALSVSDERIKGSRWSGTVEAQAPGPASLEAEHPSAPGATGIARATVAIPQAEIQTVRIHNPAQFEDPVATTLYPGDWIRARAKLDVGDRARFGGQIIDPTGILKTVSASYAQPELTVWAKAEKEGAATPVLELRPDDGGAAFETLHPVQVVPAVAGESAFDKDPRRVKTTDIDSALLLLLEELKMLLVLQKDGVKDAKEGLLKRRKAPTIPWWLPYVVFGAEAALSFVTAGVGNGIGRSLAGRTSASRDIVIGGAKDGAGGLKVFDIESAFGTALKDSLKTGVRAVLGSKGSKDEVVDEPWAIELFCDAQISALEKATINEAARWINEFASFKDVEAAQPGSGLAEVEAQRRALALESQRVKDAQFQATLKEWLLYQANTTHGVTTEDTSGGSEKTGEDKAPEGAPSEGEAAVGRPSNGTPTGGTDLGAEGRGEISFTAALDLRDPSAPVRVTSMRFATLLSSTAEAFQTKGGTIGSLGLPYTVSAARSFILGRNEQGDVWISLLTGAMGIDAWSADATRYLFQKGTGAESWGSDSEKEAGMNAGARQITDGEVGPVDIRDVPLSRKFGE